MFKKVISSLFIGALMCYMSVLSPSAQAAETVQLQFLATSDMHGMFYPYNYIANKDFKNGSCAQVATAVQALKTPNTIVIDGGDIIQDNLAEIFLQDKLHPMMLAMNDIKYDVWITGNHEYNFGLDTLKRIASKNKGALLCGNVYNPQGKRLAAPYKIFTRGGVKIGIIGMVTPNITKWDKKNLQGWRVTNPVAETQAAIKELKGKVDLLVAVDHMTVDNEYSVSGSGVRDLANACPELNLIIAAHGHQMIDGMVINGVPIIENKKSATTLGQVLMDLEKTKKGWQLKNTTTKIYMMKDYAADSKLLQDLKPYHERAIAAAVQKIGVMEDETLAPEPLYPGDEHYGKLCPTAVGQLIGDVQMYYAGDVKATATGIYSPQANIKKGDIRKCDIANVYGYDNTLYVLEMNGKQLQKYMEWSAGAYNQYQPGDLTISFNPNYKLWDLAIFKGVKYDVDISQPLGKRIKNLTWMDGTPVKDEETFKFAANNYAANSCLCSYGSVFQKGEQLPKILAMEVRSDIGNVRAMIADYIQNVKGGRLKAECTPNWRIIGNSWDEALHQQAVQALREGKLKVTNSPSGRTLNIKSITVADLEKLK